MELIFKLLVVGILAQVLVFNVNIVGAVDVAGLTLCNFPAIYNFGDSNSDTGNSQSATNFRQEVNKNVFGQYPGRACNGRLLVDFMTEKLGIPYVSAYLNSIATNFQHGANFASSGASTRPYRKRNILYNLDIQIAQFDQFKERSIDLYNQAQARNTNTNTSVVSRIPKPEDFSKALYTIDIGQNDFTSSYMDGDVDVRAALIPDLVNQLTAALKHLYEQGGRAFWIHNTAPLGCFTTFVEDHLLMGQVPKAKDHKGCYAFLDEMAREYNSQLRERVNRLRVELPEAALTYVDLYTPLVELLTNHTNLGLDMVVFDGIHRVEAANQWLANRLLNGSLSEPPIPITHACHKRAGA